MTLYQDTIPAIRGELAFVNSNLIGKERNSLRSYIL